jgi:hypothetical protein
VRSLDRRNPGLNAPSANGGACLSRRANPGLHLQLGQAQQITWEVGPFGGALTGQLVVLTQGRSEPQCLQVMGEQNLWRIAHDAPPARRLR